MHAVPLSSSLNRASPLLGPGPFPLNTPSSLTQRKKVLSAHAIAILFISIYNIVISLSLGYGAVTSLLLLIAA